MCVHRRQDNRGQDRFCLTLTEANQLIWDSMTYAQRGIRATGFTKSEDKDQTASIRVKRTEVEIEPELASAIQRIWRAMLARQFVDDPESGALITTDGYSVEFSVQTQNGKTLTRATTNPRKPPATDFIDAAFSLANYCAAPVNKRVEKHKLIWKALDKVERDLEKL